MAMRAARILTTAVALAAGAGAARAASAPPPSPEPDFPGVLVTLAVVAALVVAGVFVFRLVRASRRR